MIRNFRFPNVNDGLPWLARELLTNGDEFGSRAGTTKELMHVGITLDRPWQREIVLPIRKASVAAQVVETMWVLAGRNDVATLEPYLPRAADFSDDGLVWRSGYGPRLRNYQGVDQLAYLADTMKRSPGSRQAVASLWDPMVDTEPGKDIACNNWLSFSSRLGYLDLHVAVRSNDLIWGWSGINAFEWSALLEIVAGLSGLMVGKLHFSTTSLHLYDRHWAKAQQLGQLGGYEMFDDSPRFDARTCPNLVWFDDLVIEWFRIEALIRTGQPVDIEAFPEPMLRSWLRLLQWYWSGDESLLEPLRHTRLAAAALVGVAPAGGPQMTLDDVFNVSVRAETDREVDLLLLDEPPSCTSCGGTGTVYGREDAECPTCIGSGDKPSFFEFVNALHAEKHAAYGDSWKRRGEPGILSNIARKVDRLGAGSSTADETPFDTALDLTVYLAKYWSWLAGEPGGPHEVEIILGEYEKGYDGEHPASIDRIIEGFEFLETMGAPDQKRNLVETLLAEAYTLARQRY